MKTSSVSTLLLTAALLAVPALAQNDPNPKEAAPGAGGPMKQKHRDLVRQYDKNGDGRLDEEEKAAAHAAMRREGRGEDERRKQKLKQFDKDGDGRLNEAERAEAQKAGEMAGKNGGGDKFREQMRKRFDQDGDGKLNETEQAAADQFRAEQVKQFDADGDGRLNDAEREAAAKAFRGDKPAGKRKKDN